jgi:hypothetical protein
VRTILTCALAAALAACSGGGPTSRVVSLYGGEACWAAIDAPQKVTAYRVMMPGRVKYVRAPDTICGFEITDGPVEVDAASAKELAAILRDDAIYDWERAKGCEFDPGVAVSFVSAARRMDLLLCFHCDEIAAFENGKRVGIEDFDVARPRLLAVMRRIFPKDEAIQALK